LKTMLKLSLRMLLSNLSLVIQLSMLRIIKASFFRVLVPYSNLLVSFLQKEKRIMLLQWLILNLKKRYLVTLVLVTISSKPNPISKLFQATKSVIETTKLLSAINVTKLLQEPQLSSELENSHNLNKATLKIETLLNNLYSKIILKRVRPPSESKMKK
jgi:hypothetical protein